MAKQLAVGDRVPEATFIRKPNDPVKMSELLGGKPTVLLFYLLDFTAP